MFFRNTLQIRSMRPEDIASVRGLEFVCFRTNRGSDEELEDFLGHPSTGGVVAFLGSRLIGYLLYQINLAEGHVRLCHVAVHPRHRRTGAGSRMLHALRFSVSAVSALGFRASVSERNLECHLFLRKSGFKAVSVLRRAFGQDDAYVFTCPCGTPVESAPAAV
jgi:ribosomal protein S18 acetylase RimI-like enzyme